LIGTVIPDFDAVVAGKEDDSVVAQPLLVEFGNTRPTRTSSEVIIAE
jgi:hypothetical protein